MRTSIEFRSAAFPPYEDEEAQINPGRWGKRVAEFLKDELERAGIRTGEIYFEDWGVALPVSHDRFPVWIGCGRYEEYEDGFLCFIEPRRPFIRRWFQKIDTTTITSRIADVIEASLKKHPEVRDVRWWTEDEERRG